MSRREDEHLFLNPGTTTETGGGDPSDPGDGGGGGDPDPDPSFPETFTGTNGGATPTWDDTAHGLSEGDVVEIDSAYSGGLTSEPNWPSDRMFRVSGDSLSANAVNLQYTMDGTNWQNFQFNDDYPGPINYRATGSNVPEGTVI